MHFFLFLCVFCRVVNFVLRINLDVNIESQICSVMFVLYCFRMLSSDLLITTESASSTTTSSSDETDESMSDEDKSPRHSLRPFSTAHL
jgi:hypothetical protein